MRFSLHKISFMVITALSFSCSSLPKAETEVVIVEGASASEARMTQNQGLLVFGLEDKKSSLKKCAYFTAPDGLLSVGLLAVIPNPATPLIAIVYYGGSYYSCYWQRQNDSPSVQMNLVVEEARKKTADELRESFNKLRDKLDVKTNDYVKDIEQIEKHIKASGDEEKRAIERTGSKVLKELYDQLDGIRNTPIQIKEIETEEETPKTLLDTK